MKTKNITKGQIHDFVREQLRTNDIWAKAALLRIYDYQTQDEKQSEQTSHNNKVGFTGSDAEILSSFAKQLINRKFLSPKQMNLLHKRIHKYHNQIIDISDSEKIEKQAENWKRENEKKASTQLSLKL
jgi:hypothetical protein